LYFHKISINKNLSVANKCDILIRHVQKFHNWTFVSLNSSWQF